MTARFIVGDVLDVLPTLEPGSVDLVLTSPPFLALRSYLPADHPDKAKEGGSQPTPGAFIDWLVDVVEALDRVLAPHGSIVIELGDTYAGGGPGLTSTDAKWGEIPYKLTLKGSEGWPASKSLTLIPELFRMTLVYGFNPLTGRQTKRWRLRNVIRWVRPNPPVGALGDKFRPATSELMVFCRTDEAGRRRYFDLDAVREPYSERFQRGIENGEKRGAMLGAQVPDGQRLERPHGSAPGSGVLSAGIPKEMASDHAGAPPLDWWNIPLLDGDCESCGGTGGQQLIREGLYLEACPSCGGSGRQGASPYGPPPKPKSHARTAKGVESAPRSEKSANRGGNWATLPELHETQGSPPLDWWNIPLLDGEEPVRQEPKRPTTGGKHDGKRTPFSGDRGGSGFETDPLGAPPLDWWNIPPGGYQGAHYAVWPPELLIKPIKAMCPEKVCRTCGEPSRRIVGEATYVNNAGRPARMDMNQPRYAPGVRQFEGHGDNAAHRIAETLGFTDCSHDNYRPGLVLDPFAGSGTTLAVAVGHGRDAVGIDLDERNARLAEERIGFFLEVAE